VKMDDVTEHLPRHHSSETAAVHTSANCEGVPGKDAAVPATTAEVTDRAVISSAGIDLENGAGRALTSDAAEELNGDGTCRLNGGDGVAEEWKNDESSGLTSFGLDRSSSIDVYALASYSFGRKEMESGGQEARGVAFSDVTKHRKERFQQRGMRRSVAAVVLVHSHTFPHVLLLQRSSGQGSYMLPGGRLRPGECELDGLQRKLTAKLSPATADGSGISEWEIGEERTHLGSYGRLQSNHFGFP
jgi:Nucleotide hydrolase